MDVLFEKDKEKTIERNIFEKEMKKQGYKMTLISTQADEDAQHFYRKLGYIDCGGLIFHDTPFDQPMEMFFRKVL